MTSMHPTLTRRDFVKVGGALVVTAALPAVPGSGTAEAAERTLDPTKLASWLEIRADGTIVARTGKTETGTSASTFYAQIIAEELDVDPSTITMVLGHTDETPEGGFSAGFLSGAGNLRIARMGDVPEIRTVFASADDHGINGGGEGANGVASIAVAAAVFDATGVHPRRLPLTPAYLKGLLSAQA